MKSIGFFSLSLISAVLISAPTFAESFTPKMNALLSFEAQNDFVTNSDDPDAEVNTATTTIEPYIILSLMEKIALEGGFVFEQIQDPDAGDDTFFDNEGAYVEQIKVSYNSENWGVFAGKYNPTFGTAWDITPGVYGVDFAEDYELFEKIGLGGNINFDSDSLGSHTLSANTFFADTTFLSESTLTRRDELDHEDGGLSNTEGLNSYSITLDSTDFAGFKGLNSHIGYNNQAEGDEDTDLTNEKGYVIGANYTLPINKYIEANFLGEWAGIRDQGGTVNTNVDYFTSGLSLSLYNNWNVSGSFTTRNTEADGSGDIDDSLYQISAGYAFDNGLAVDLGYKISEVSGMDQNMLGLLVSYNYEF